MNIQNKKASFDFYFEYTLESGVVLQGTEVKSIRLGEVNMSDSYCSFENGELFVHNIHISEYKFGTYNNHECKRSRKLLLKKAELKKLHSKVKEQGFTIVPVKMYINSRGFVKITIALAKGKKNYDKRESIKENDLKRDMNRED